MDSTVVEETPHGTHDELKPLSPSALKLYGILLVTFMGSISWGIDTSGRFTADSRQNPPYSSVISSVNGMRQYTDYFNIGGGESGGGQGIITGMLFSIFTFGCIAGAFIAGPIADSDRWGRRGAMFIASVVILAGVATVTAAQTRTYLFVGRFLIGFGSTLNMSASPSYVAELSPPQWRGRLAGLYNTFSFIGSIICSSMTIATGRFASSWSWRLPFAVQLVPTAVMALGVWFIPESPRWLMSVGRKHEARKVLATYHGNGDSNAFLVELEYRQLEEYIKTKPKKAGFWHELFDYSELFNTRAARYRTVLICWTAFCVLWSGIGVFYFLTVVFDMAGVQTQEGRLTYSAVAIALGVAGAIAGSLLADKIGRRALWLAGASSCAILLSLSAAFVAKQMSSAAIAFLLMFSFAHNMAYVPLQGMYPAEVLRFSSRGKGLALYCFCGSAASLVNSFAGSVAFENIGWKYLLVFAAFDVVQVVVTWFCVVETKGRTLEELDEIFGNAHPVTVSLEKKRPFS